ncbi:MAG: polyribonucleotide nucleotidyltransferase [Pseudobdellovibrionaceae bacterium]|nr:polyribonucleotide nucleotidyltransferase [Bdellovibrionales bacterium]USN48739.1 MAG: polyribonucleotide nucleotidyltransferase [Pseudobdellovibrionaceae bacterium]
MNKQTVTFELNGKEITLETGRLAKQADGSVLVTCGSNVVLVTVVSSKRETDLDFFPLTVEYSEKFYSTGKIPGGYFKREGRPTSEAILNCRLIDRPLRPCFPDGYFFDTQIVPTILSYDGQYPINTLASIGASTALHISDIPFDGPIATVNVGRVDGKLVANPDFSEMERSDLEIMIAGTKEGILMVEGESQFISEEDVLAALQFGHESILPILNAQNELRQKTGSKAKREFTAKKVDPDFSGKAEQFLKPKIKAALGIKEKMARYEALDAAKKEAEAALLAEVEESLVAARKKDLGKVFGDLKYDLARLMILDDKVRIDGRDTKTVRPIWCEVGMLPRAHGSGVFTRGETQVLGTVTLGTADDEQKIDALQGTITKRFMLHYNFPPYCVGETGRMGGQSRREVGHGFLAERALKAVIPDYEKFPYTLRVVSEVLESNGSSSMGTVCSGTLAMLDAGVPIKGNVAGIAMGLITDGDRYAVLTDILGDEDHLGDMDFKVAGTRDGITALQMDIKIASIKFSILKGALDQAKEGRLHILGEMEKTIDKPRGEISQYAPRIETIKVKPEKVREIIGAGGKVIRGIIEDTGVKIDIEDDGTVHVASADPEASKKAIQMIMDICAEAEVGKTYPGRVVKITDFGAFVEILPNTSGLLHISEISHERIRSVNDVLKEGEAVEVKVLDVDRAGRIRLSRKALLEKGE